MRRRGRTASTWSLPLVLLLICSSALPLSGQATETSTDDVLALKVLRNAFHMDKWVGDPCFPAPWEGLRCDIAVARVVLINLRGRRLNGFLPTTIKDLTALQFLDLSSNNFSGSIPEALAHLPKLATLALDYNDFCGRIPVPLQNRSSFSFSGNPRLCPPGNSCDTRTCVTYPDPPAFSPESKKTSGMNLVIGAIIGGCIVFGILGGLFMCFYLRSQRKKASTLLPIHSPLDSTEIEAKQYGDKSYHSPARSYHSRASSEGLRNAILSPFRESSEFQTNTMLSQAAGYIPRADIVTATNNFSLKIGEGGYGPVYKGKLSNGKEVAVKVNKICSQGTEEFMNEVGLLTRIHHRNLVSLLGFCEYGDERFLIYEYQEKGTLSDLLWGTEAAENNPLDWKTRLDIALNAAKGLEYLHTGCDPKIIHRDIKSSNILVDDKYVAKVADFGVSKATPEGGSSSSAYSTFVRGTPGYLDPEYLLSHRLSTKSDVYSFGIVLMEIIAGCRPQATLKDGTRFNIVDLFTDALSTGDIFGVADTALDEKFNPESMWKVADLAYNSVEREGARRPDMSQVVRCLTEAIELEKSFDPAASPPTRSFSRAVTVKLPR